MTDNVTLTAAQASPPLRRPYPGFRPFRRAEWKIFFGRDGQIEALLALLAARHFICVHGPSGCGKSSLIEAGLIATLEREARRFGTAWNASIFRPGTSPLWNLARGLARALDDTPEPSSDRILEIHARLTRPGGSIALAAKESGLGEKDNLLLVADQFEELFRFREVDNGLEARRFVELLLGVFDQQPPGVHVAIAMRSDFLGDCASMIGLAEAVNAAPFLTTALTEQGLRDAIVGPAEMFDGDVEPEVVERMLRDSEGEPDRLPLLQHTLMRCWDQAAAQGSPKRITLQVYESAPIGGVQNALNRHANAVMEGLPGYDREVERIFRSLADVDADGRAIRRAVAWGRLCAEVGAIDDASQERLRKVLDAFRDESCGFLGRPPLGETLKPDSIVDVAHEALIRRWDKMSDPPLTGRSNAVPLPRQRNGWLWEQARDTAQYRELVSRTREADDVLPPAGLDNRHGWWLAQPRTTAWGRRLGGDREATDEDVARNLANVDGLFQRSIEAGDKARKAELGRARLKRFTVIGAIILIVGSVGSTLVIQRIALQHEKVAVDEQEQRWVQQRRVLAEVKSQLQQADDKLQQTALPPGPVNANAPSAEQRTEIVPQAANPVVVALPAPIGNQPNAEAACKGSMWIGADGAGNLRATAAAGGGPVTVATVKRGDTYVTTTNVRLRRGAPATDYVQGESIGIVPKGAQVAALGEPVPYKRPNGSTQYWLDVRVAGQICSLVYFQFSGGTLDDARAVATDLQALGYLVPGQEQLRTASGLAEVRYYYDEDKERAAQLARETQMVVSKLQLAAGRRIKPVDMTSWPRQKPPIGTLELWLDLSSPTK